jgi:hypothetical protein
VIHPPPYSAPPPHFPPLALHSEGPKAVAAGITAGTDSYGIEISDRGTVTFAEGELAAPVDLALGAR